MAIHRKFTFPKGIKLKKEVVKNKQIQKKTDFRQKQFKTNGTKESKSAKTTGSSAIIVRYLPNIEAIPTAFARMTIAGLLLWSYTIFRPQGRLPIKARLIRNLFAK